MKQRQTGRPSASLGWFAALILVLGANSARAASPSFTLSPSSATLPLIVAGPADILNPAVPPVPGPLPPPVTGIPAAALGLLPGDIVTGLSFGIVPPFPLPGGLLSFSVDGASVGIPFAPPPAHVACEAGGGQALGDVFVTEPFPPPVFPNTLLLDGNGIPDSPCGPPPSAGLGLIEPAADDVVNLEMCPSTFAYSGVALTIPVYLTLAPGSPTLIALGAGAADILVVAPPAGPPAVLLPAAVLGLVPGPPGCGAPLCDQINGFDFAIGVPGIAVFTLAPGSPSLGVCGISAADVLVAPAAPCFVVHPAASLGLAPTDSIDALDVYLDTDGDFVANECDNCLYVANNNQLDSDADGGGDACDYCIGFPDVDSDGDGYCNANDNCAFTPNPSQADTDGDTVGDACDPCTGSPNLDGDFDGYCDANDNCPAAANPSQSDTDGDTVGDACDPCIGSPNLDADLDGYCDTNDNCPAAANPSQSDTDSDTLGDACDPCPADPSNTNCCPASPSSCTGGFAKGTLIKKETAGQEKLIVKMLKGPLIAQTDYGDPLVGGGTKYQLCVYGDTTLVGEIEVDRAGDTNCSGGATTCWNPIGAAPPAGKGYKYKDTSLASDGTSKLLLKGGPTSAGKSKLLWKGSGAAIPAGVTPLLTSAASVTVQLHGDDAPGLGCWSVTLTTIKKHTADFFKGK